MKNDKTIVLCGGFGNILLQIHFGKYVEQIFGHPVRFNTSFVTEELVTSVSQLLEEPISETITRPFKLSLRHRLWLALLRRTKLLSLFVEPDFDKIIERRSLINAKYIIGYFQSFKYSSEPLLSEEKLAKKTSRDNLKRIHNMSHDDVVVHLRFGDYLNPAASAFHGMLRREYYTDAIKTHFPYSRVIVITDDTDMAKHFFSDFLHGDVQIWSDERYSALDDFYFLTSARNIIISNSSFSYCAALQASRLRKTCVIAPKDWFLGRSINVRYRFPKNWCVR